jgi:hypothetical protein
MASIMMFWMIFGVVLILIGVFVPPDTRLGVFVSDADLTDYLTTGRLFASAGIAAAVTGLSWTFVPGDVS